MKHPALPPPDATYFDDDTGEAYSPIAGLEAAVVHLSDAVAELTARVDALEAQP